MFAVVAGRDRKGRAFFPELRAPGGTGNTGFVLPDTLGWCFGGGQSLQIALNSQDHPLAATIIYYGRLVTDNATLASIKWPVLGIFGDQDMSIQVDTVKAFESTLKSNGTPNEIYIYKGVGHAFANPSGDNYAPKETQDAWHKTLSFLKKYTSG